MSTEALTKKLCKDHNAYLLSTRLYCPDGESILVYSRLIDGDWFSRTLKNPEQHKSTLGFYWDDIIYSFRVELFPEERKVVTPPDTDTESSSVDNHNEVSVPVGCLRKCLEPIQYRILRKWYEYQDKRDSQDN